MLATLQTPSDFVAMFKRRKWPITMVLLGGTALSLNFALSQPSAYEAAALIQIEAPQVLDAQGRPVTSSSNWLQLLEARLMVRDNIAQLIQDYHIFDDAPGMSPSEQILAMRRMLRLEPVQSAAPQVFGADTSTGLVRIIAQASEPEVAAGLANTMAANVQRLSADTVAEKVRDSLEFYSREESRLGEEISVVEKEMNDFRRTNFDILPTGLDNRREELARLDTDLRTIDGDIVTLQLQIAAKSDSSVVERREKERLNQQLEALEARRSQITGRVSDIESNARQSLSVEAQLESYTSRLERLRDQMQETVSRKNAAETLQRRETEQTAERFIVLEKAIAPEHPVQSRRRKFLALGLAVTMMAALALAIVLEALRPVLRTAGQVERASGLRPVISLPDLSK